MISVCLPTKNAGPGFARTLRAWREQAAGEEVELVVVDSGSRDATVATARELGARVLSIPPQEFNHGETRNLLAREARGDLLVFTVQDACPADNNLLAELTRPLREQTELAAVTGRQEPHPDADLVARWEVAHHNTVLDAAPPLRSALPAAGESTDFLARFRGLAFDNVCSALRRRVWEALPFARIEFAEDLEWAQRALRAGHALLRNPAARVYHSHNRQPYERLKRAFVTRRATSRILGLPAALPLLSEQQALAGLGAYAAALAKLFDGLGFRPERVTHLHLPSSPAYLLRRGLRRVPLPRVQRLALALRSNLAADHLCGSFNGAARLLLRFHKGLSGADARFVTLQLGAQMLGDFLGDYAHAAETTGALPEWLAEMAPDLSRGV